MPFFFSAVLSWLLAAVTEIVKRETVEIVFCSLSKTDTECKMISTAEKTQAQIAQKTPVFGRRPAVGEKTRPRRENACVGEQRGKEGEANGGKKVRKEQDERSGDPADG